MKKFLVEMAHVASAVYNAFKPHKLNYEMLGNGEPHLHWHIFPRYRSDPNFTSPVWIVDKSIRYADSAKPTYMQLRELKNHLLRHL
jgi:diadenosine tetraphosphate (Ap4A) HIT family hydrolase